ncbi:MAG TPA: hypothetical protein VGQ02_04455 [Candidatus Limnocylindrales bacterium]|jgi:hypothetical protein|nr:hypothetical protein [Candidatus Limnocylindrales bacterium]
MHWYMLPAAIVLGGVVAIVLATNPFRSAPAEERLAGVQVAVAGYTIDDLPNDAHRLNLRVTLTSAADVNECVAFTLDQPFAGRRLQPLTADCPRPRAGTSTVSLKFEQLTDDDLQFPSHTLVWGVPGGRCGPILELFGVCVVEQAGTADFDLPSRTVLPTFGPIGSFVPFFSFGPP